MKKIFRQIDRLYLENSQDNSIRYIIFGNVDSGILIFFKYKKNDNSDN